MRVKGQSFKEGDWISLDGTTGRVIKGKLNTLDASPDDPNLVKHMSWVDPHRRLRVRANADIPRDAIQTRLRSAPKASAYAAPSICSSPRDRLPHMRAMIMTNNEKTVARR